MYYPGERCGKWDGIELDNTQAYMSATFAEKYYVFNRRDTFSLFMGRGNLVKCQSEEHRMFKIGVQISLVCNNHHHPS